MKHFLDTLYQKFIQIRKNPWMHIFTFIEIYFLYEIFTTKPYNGIKNKLVDIFMDFDIVTNMFTQIIVVLFIPFIILCLIKLIIKSNNKIVEYINKCKSNFKKLFTQNWFYNFILKPTLKIITTIYYYIIQPPCLILFYYHVAFSILECLSIGITCIMFIFWGLVLTP